jgi:hypothetical protein
MKGKIIENLEDGVEAVVGFPCDSNDCI